MKLYRSVIDEKYAHVNLNSPKIGTKSWAELQLIDEKTANITRKTAKNGRKMSFFLL